MPATATPRKPQTLARKLVETRNTSRNRSLAAMLGLGESERDAIRSNASAVNDVYGRGTLAGFLGIPGDLGGLMWDAGAAVNNKIKDVEVALGLVSPKQARYVPSGGMAYGGAEHIGHKMQEYGLVSPTRRPVAETLASLISPTGLYATAAKAPQMARAGVRMLDNLAAPRTMGSQTGAIENLWHGSPHTFDRFDLSKIGTGEGAQAYGHGAYLAESKGVGESYKASTSRPEIEVRGVVYKADDSGVFRGADGNTAGNLPDYLYYAMNGIVGSKPDISNAQLAEEVESFLQTRRGVRQSDIEKAKLAIINGEIVRRDTGNLYQTRLAWPDPAREAADPLSPDHFLHWDKPLSEQSPVVLDALAQYKDVKHRTDGWTLADTAETIKAAKANQLQHLIDDQRMNMTGSDVLGLFGGAPGMPSVMATERLMSGGIPGIRYLDGGSRGAGAGSHNYVVFDDRLIDIVSRNGQSVK